jgi:DNA-binding response OmpR family regulator
MSEKNTVLVIDDNPQLSKLLFLFLKDSFDVVMAENGTEGIEMWRKYKPSLVILDIMLPDISGYEVCATAKSDMELRNTPIVFLSAKGCQESREKGYLLGAVNYLVKPVQKSELNAIIQSTIRMMSQNHQQYSEIEIEDVKINTDTMEVFFKDELLDFTPNEFRILYAFMIKLERVLSRDAILKALGKSEKNISDRAIDSHISHIRKKLKLSSLKIKSVYGEGYKLIVEKSDT